LQRQPRTQSIAERDTGEAHGTRDFSVPSKRPGSLNMQLMSPAIFSCVTDDLRMIERSVSWYPSVPDFTHGPRLMIRRSAQRSEDVR
jgi:hypothetical protein